jgi:HEAT repeat protein
MTSRGDAVDDMFERLVVALGEADHRVQKLRSDVSSAAVQGFIQSILVDRSIPPEVMSRALWIAALLPYPKVAADVVEIIRSRPEVAIIAADVLCRLRAEVSLPELRSILMEYSLPAASRGAAARAASWLFDKGFKGAFIQILGREEEDPEVLSEVLNALGMSQLHEDKTDAANDISRCLQSPFPDVRLSALAVLGNIGARQSVPQITERLDDNDVGSNGRRVAQEAARVIRLLRHDA